MYCRSILSIIAVRFYWQSKNNFSSESIRAARRTVRAQRNIWKWITPPWVLIIVNLLCIQDHKFYCIAFFSRHVSGLTMMPGVDKECPESSAYNPMVVMDLWSRGSGVATVPRNYSYSYIGSLLFELCVCVCVYMCVHMCVAMAIYV